MGALISPRNVVVLLVLLTIVAALAAVSVAIRTAPTVRGSPPALPLLLPTLPIFETGEEADEIDPEACLTTTLKLIEGPILVDFAVIRPLLITPTPPPDVSVVREQTIAQIIQSCNVDDEVRPPNLERELDTDIEVFSIICEKLSDLSVQARCEVLRVAQEENAPFLSGGSGSRRAPAPEPAAAPEPAPAPPPAPPPE